LARRLPLQRSSFEAVAVMTGLDDVSLIGDALGTTISGSFDYDADTNTISNVDVTTSGGSVIPSATFYLSECCSSDLNVATFPVLWLVDTANANEVGADYLAIDFASAPTDAGSTIALFETVQGTCIEAKCNAGTFTQNLNVTGDITASAAVPEPAAFILFGTAATISLYRKRVFGIGQAR
jgi:hypothetical protein